MCPRQRINSWPTACTRLRHILAIPGHGPQDGAHWLLPLADLVMLQQGKHQPCLPLALAPQPLPQSPTGCHQDPRCLCRTGSSIPAAHRCLAWLHLRSQPVCAERIGKEKHWGLLSQSVGCRGRARCQQHPSAAGTVRQEEGGCGLARLLPVVAESHRARPRSQPPATLASAGWDRAETLPGRQLRAAMARKPEEKPRDGYPDSIPMSNEKQMSHRLSRAVKIIKE